uniref:Uncharacterized protein n=1 Tax=Timema monikensis TaxID=170555 RepID=A0A7R9DXN3_9NEOP|nr:unnamed protein product [Timema monikensis]
MQTSGLWDEPRLEASVCLSREENDTELAEHRSFSRSDLSLVRMTVLQNELDFVNFCLSLLFLAYNRPEIRPRSHQCHSSLLKEQHLRPFRLQSGRSNSLPGTTPDHLKVNHPQRYRRGRCCSVRWLLSLPRKALRPANIDKASHNYPIQLGWDLPRNSVCVCVCVCGELKPQTTNLVDFATNISKQHTQAVFSFNVWPAGRDSSNNCKADLHKFDCNCIRKLLIETQDMSEAEIDPIDSKREEFRKYLERAGVMEALTKVLVGLYEEAEKPTNALEYPL